MPGKDIIDTLKLLTLLPIMRISFLGKRHYTNKDAFAERFGRVYQLPLHWHRQGHAVQLHLFDYHSLQREQSTADGFDVFAEPAASPAALWRVARSLAAFEPDVIIGSGDSLIGLLSHWLARRRRAAFVFDAYDDYRTFGSSRVFLGWDAFGWLVRRAGAIMYASQRLADAHPSSQPCLVAPNGVDPQQFAAADQGIARQAHGLPPKEQGHTVGYFGGMERDRGVNELIDAMRRLRPDNPELTLLIAGRLHADTAIDEPWIRYLGQVPHAVIPSLLNACDVVALPYLRSQFMDMGASCKIAEYLFCRRPIAATNTPNFVDNFPHQAEELDGLLAAPGDADDLARVLRAQLADPRIVSAPEDMSWARIASCAIKAIEGALRFTPSRKPDTMKT